MIRRWWQRLAAWWWSIEDEDPGAWYTPMSGFVTGNEGVSAGEHLD